MPRSCRTKKINFTYSYSKTLTELLIITTIVALLFLSLTPYDLFKQKTKNQNLIKLKKLQQALYLARSEAITKQSLIQLCPTYNRLNCSLNWTKGIIITNVTNLTEQQPIILHYLPINFSEPLLRFKFFGGNHQQTILFLPNGLTNNHGHFCVNSENDCLYINNAGKIYIVSKKYA